jgi:hypothetical protein
MTPQIPLFRIEVRPRGEGDQFPWTAFSIAASETQKKQKLDGYGATYPEFEFQAVPNEWAEPTDPTAEAEELEELRQFKKSIVENFGTDDVAYLMGERKEAAETIKRLATAERKISRLEQDLLRTKGTEPEPSPAFEYPFEVGDSLRDVHTDVIVTVTAIGPDASGGDGFDFEGPGGVPGYCPRASLECYEPAKNGETAGKKKSRPKS